MPRLRGWVLAQEAPRVTRPCAPPLFAIRGSAHWVPGKRPGLRPRLPLPPASPLSRSVVNGGGGGAVWHNLRRNLLQPSSAVLGAWLLRALGAAARVSGQ